MEVGATWMRLVKKTCEGLGRLLRQTRVLDGEEGGEEGRSLDRRFERGQTKLEPESST